MTRARTLAVAAFDRGFVLALLVLVVYICFAPTTIVGGDNSEFAALSVLGGRAHPSGYPLYLLWLQATSWLPGESVAHTAAIATCILGALAVLVLHAACRAWGARPLSATFACAIFAASPVVMIFHTEAEVFALNALVVATVLVLAAPAGPLRGARRTIALGFVAGLGLSDHMTCVLVAPVGLYGAVCGIRESPRRTVVIVTAAVGALALGLLPYLQTALAADTPSSWGYSDGLAGTVHHFLRIDYGAGTLSAHGGEALPVDSLLGLTKTLARSWWWLPLALGLVTLAVHATRPAEGRRRVAWAAYAATWLLAGPVFVSRFNIDPRGFGIHIVERLFLMPMLLLAVPVAVGIDWISGPRLARIGSVWAVVLFPLLAAPSFAEVTAEHTSAVQQSLINTLNALPPNAAMVTNGDDFAFGIPYIQQVLGIRRDVIEINWPTLGFSWSLARLAARGVPYDPRAPGPDVPSVRLADLLNKTGHPVFVDDFASNILGLRPNYPYAGLTRVLPKDAPVPPLDDIFAMNVHAFAQFDLSYPPPGVDDGFMTLSHIRYEDTWERIAWQYKRAGFPVPAADAMARAAAFSPRD